MAAVVVTPTVVTKTVFGNKRAHLVNFALDTGDYAAGGVPITAAMCGLVHIDSVLFEGAAYEVSATPTGMIPQWDPAASSVIMYQSAAADAPFAEKGVEAFGAGASFRALVIGH